LSPSKNRAAIVGRSLHCGEQLEDVGIFASCKICSGSFKSIGLESSQLRVKTVCRITLTTLLLRVRDTLYFDTKGTSMTSSFRIMFRDLKHENLQLKTDLFEKQTKARIFNPHLPNRPLLILTILTIDQC